MVPAAHQDMAAIKGIIRTVIVAKIQLRDKIIRKYSSQLKRLLVVVHNMKKSP